MLVRFALAALTLVATAAPASAALVTFADRTAYRAANGIGTVEDFESAALTPGAGIGVTGTINATTANAAYAVGEVAPGFDLSADSNGLIAAVGANYAGLGMASGSLFSNSSSPLSLSFQGGIFAFAFDALDLAADGAPATLTLFGLESVLGSFQITSGGPLGTFFGVTSDQRILGARLDSPGIEGIDNLEFGMGTTDVPEPAALGLLGLGVVALGARRRRKAA